MDGLRPGVLLGDDDASRLVSGERGRDLCARVCIGSECQSACAWPCVHVAHTQDGGWANQLLPELGLAHLHAAVLLQDDKVPSSVNQRLRYSKRMGGIRAKAGGAAQGRVAGECSAPDGATAQRLLMANPSATHVLPSNPVICGSPVTVTASPVVRVLGGGGRHQGARARCTASPAPLRHEPRERATGRGPAGRRPVTQSMQDASAAGHGVTRGAHPPAPALAKSGCWSSGFWEDVNNTHPTGV